MNSDFLLCSGSFNSSRDFIPVDLSAIWQQLPNFTIVKLFQSCDSVLPMYIKPWSSPSANYIYFLLEEEKKLSGLVQIPSTTATGLAQVVEHVAVRHCGSIGAVLTDQGSVYTVANDSSKKSVNAELLIGPNDLVSRVVSVQVAGSLYLLTKDGTLYSTPLVTEQPTESVEVSLVDQKIDEICGKARMLFVRKQDAIFKLESSYREMKHTVSRKSGNLKVISSSGKKITPVTYMRSEGDKPVMMTVTHSQLFILTVSGEILMLNSSTGVDGTLLSISNDAYTVNLHPKVVEEGIKSINSNHGNNLFVTTYSGNVYGSGYNANGELGANRKDHDTAMSICLSYNDALTKHNLARDYQLQGVQCVGWSTFIWFKNSSALSMFLKRQNYRNKSSTSSNQQLHQEFTMPVDYADIQVLTQLTNW